MLLPKNTSRHTLNQPTAQAQQHNTQPPVACSSLYTYSLSGIIQHLYLSSTVVDQSLAWMSAPIRRIPRI